ncbi:MAG: HNH endonuclease [Candidatus Marinimicrobia bacterium]|nr:HNH endonuclease [Candidatus Neomarinimicrobiota bacterium]
MSDYQIRLKAFSWLREKSEVYDDILPRKLLQEGFEYDGIKIPLVSPQGIFKPRQMKLPLTITSISNGPYDDKEIGNFIIYKYRGTDINHRDNVGLRNAMAQNVPLIYFNSIMPGKYISVWPAFIIADMPNELTFKIAFDDKKLPIVKSNKISDSSDARREYITTTVKRRIHQQSFRERVLYAYKTQCTLCRLKHKELLDAAHIIPDSDPASKPTVDNGLALCKIHHAAYDKFFIGITPDYTIEIRDDLLREVDGPMLQHGLKELNKLSIQLPTKAGDRPNKEFLEIKYQQFLHF